jgi:SAM-dependent methyltransferase
MPYADGAFDAVLSVGVVEHEIKGPRLLLEEMQRVTRENGVLLLVVPYENAVRTLIHRPLCFIRYLISNALGMKLEFEEYRFSSHDIINDIRNVGWDIVEVSWVELASPDKSYSLWVDWGNLFRNKRSNEPFSLNAAGRFLKRIFTGISPWFNAEGIIIAARKKQ